MLVIKPFSCYSIPMTFGGRDMGCDCCTSSLYLCGLAILVQGSSIESSIGDVEGVVLVVKEHRVLLLPLTTSLTSQGSQGH